MMNTSTVNRLFNLFREKIGKLLYGLFKQPAKPLITVRDEAKLYKQPVLAKFLDLYKPPTTPTPTGFIHPLEAHAMLQHLTWLFPLYLPNPVQDKTASSANTVINAEFNQNVEPIFFDRSQYKGLMDDPNNALEQAWRRRILYQTTPRGNVMMYYDAFKEGFAYYADQSVIPYEILNTLAMKYTMRFRCLHFFIDEKVVPHNPSPLIQIVKQELLDENNKKKEIMQHLLVDTAQVNPFVKFKQPVVAASSLVKKPAEDITMLRNKFIYMGKIRNFSILQEKPNKLGYIKPSVKTAYDFFFRSAENSQKNLMNYKAFKQNASQKNT